MVVVLAAGLGLDETSCGDLGDVDLMCGGLDLGGDKGLGQGVVGLGLS